MQIRYLNYGQQPATVFQPQAPAPRQSSPSPAPASPLGAFADGFSSSLNARMNRYPKAPASPDRLLNKQPLNAAGFRSRPAAAGLFGLGGVKGLF